MKTLKATSYVSKIGCKEVQVLKLEGNLDSNTAQKLDKIISRLTKQEKYNIILDCELLEYISSKGFGILVKFQRVVRSHKGDLKIARVPKKIHEVFVALGLADMMSIYDELEQALEAFDYSDGICLARGN